MRKGDKYMAEIKYIVFALGEQKYAIKLERIKGIEQDYTLVPIPVGAEHIKGIIHLRDEVIAVLDLKKHFQIYDTAGNAEIKLLVTETHGIRMGIEVDQVLGIVELPEENVNSVPKVAVGSETDYIENVIKTSQFSENGKDEIMLSISVDSVMSDSEFDDVATAMEKV
jgi:purine-binding chemotaxis protein CheW